MFTTRTTCILVFLFATTASMAFISPPPPPPAAFISTPPLSTEATVWPTEIRLRKSIVFSSNNVDKHDFEDFAEFSSTQLASSSSDNVDNTSKGTDDDSFLSSLQSRVQQVQDQSKKLPLMILDTMLPRQVLQIQIQHPTLKSLMRHRVNMETPTLGMLGMARLSTGGMVPLKTGVEVEIVQMDKADVSSTMSATSSGGGEGGEEPWDISLRAGRRFIIEGDVEKTEEGWTMAAVSFLDSSSEEENEVKQFSKPSTAEQNSSDRSSTTTTGDRLSLARAISNCRQFTEPNMNMKDNASLVDRWIELAKQNERHPGQIDTLLKQLGTIPPEHEPSERALWVGALINPLPSMGVAIEIRPALLVSKRAEERVQVALDGIFKSIRHMEGSAKMW